MSIEVKGQSDDTIGIFGDIREEFTEKHASDDGDFLAFSDGTLLRIAFDPDGSGNWRITPLAQGAAVLTIEQTTGQGSTDTATLIGDIRWVVQGTNWVKR